MSLGLFAAAAETVDIEELAQQLESQHNQMEMTALIAGVIILAFIALVTWLIVRWADLKGLGVATMTVLGVLSPIGIYVAIYSMVLGSPVGLLNSLFSGKMQPVLVTGVVFLTGPIVTWSAIMKRNQAIRKELQQSSEAFE